MYLSKILSGSNSVPTRLQYDASVQNSNTPLMKPQSQPLHEAQVKNDAGGYVFQVDDMIFFQRFLFLGTEKGTFYTSEKEHTFGNIECMERLLKANRGEEMLNMMLKINAENRVARSGPMHFALAYLAKLGDAPLRKKVYDNLSQFLRIPTHLFEFLEYAKTISKNKKNSCGWGRLQREFIQRWYSSKDVEQLTYQVTKYQQRNGWNHRDVFRLAHVTPAGKNEQNATDTAQRKLLYSWIVKKELPLAAKDGKENGEDHGKVYRFLNAFAKVQKMTDAQVDDIVRMIGEYRFVREHLPTAILNSAPVWEALLQDMPLNALIRNLNKLTKLGIFDGYGNRHLKSVVEKLTNETYLAKARIHPLKLMVAMATYAKGRGDKGSLEWTPNQSICDALNDAYYLSFKFVEPTGKRFFIGLDVSGSMGYQQCIGTSLSAREGSACLALTLMKTEKDVLVKGFSHHLVDVPLSPMRRLDDNIASISNIPFGATDLSLPIRYALKKNIPVDCFVILSDNETWSGNYHPSECLRAYRKKTGLDARYVNIQMCATKFSAADPDDVHSLEIAGFDSGMLETIAEFLNWELI